MVRAKGAKRNKRQKISSGTYPVLFFVLVGFAAWMVPEYRLWLGAIDVLFVVIWLGRLIKKHRIPRTIREIDSMNGRDFEHLLVKLFKRLGYKTRHVGGNGGDFGADLIVEKDSIKVAVQAKNYDTNRVGNDAVQQAIAGAAYYDCAVAMVVTNSTFTKAAKQQAQGSNLPVTLWDRKILEKALKRKL